MVTAATGASIENLNLLANRLRRDVLRSTNEAGSGHPTSCFSCAELMSTLFFRQIETDVDNPDSRANDHFILSKGHAAPILWSVLKEANAVSDEELLSLREFESKQEGHPTPRSEWVNIATGSLGQGLSAGLGMAIKDKREGKSNRTYVLCGDGEMAEGSVWEAASLASSMKISNLSLIVDVNARGQTGETLHGHVAEVYKERLEAFGWNVIVVDGHDVPSIIEAFEGFESETDRPTAIVAKTVKGKGVASLEGDKGSHGKVAPDFDEALSEIPDELPSEPAEIRKPSRSFHEEEFEFGYKKLEFPSEAFPDDEDASPRKVFGKAVEQLGTLDENVWVFDGDVSNSTYTNSFQNRFNERFVQSYIAEQNMVGMASGVNALGGVPFVATFAAFLSRAHDQIRMAAVSRSNLKFAGTHAGIATGEDGPSQMGLEDVAMFRSIPNSIVLQPCDSHSVFGCVELMRQHEEVGYLRIFRPSVPTLRKGSKASHSFRIGGSHTLKSSGDDEIAIIATGITTHYAMEAANELEKQGISSRVVDCYSVKPIDKATLRDVAKKVGRLVVVEDHYEEGGLGEAAFAAISGIPCDTDHLYVDDVPRSGSQEKLAKEFGIDAETIVRIAKKQCRAA